MVFSRLRGMVARHVGYGARLRLLDRHARTWRRLALRRTVVVGVTGSTGKTTTKELIFAALSASMRGTRTPGSSNAYHGRLMFGTMPWHRFAVAEMSEVTRTGTPIIARQIDQIAPAVAVVTNVGRDHVEHLGGPDAMAREIGKLVAAVPAHGLTVLNADDSRVRAMAGQSRGRVVTYGLGEGADYCAVDIVDGWPERLAFTVVAGHRRRRVTTRLCGDQWVGAVLAALAAADALGVPLEDAARAIGRVEPVDRRMEPHERSDGIAFIMDDFKCSFPTIAPALAYMARARAQRKIVVMGTISDYEGDPRRAARTVARDALAVADMVLFVGPMATQIRPGTMPGVEGRLHRIISRKSARAFLARNLRPGDLVLVKASHPADDFQDFATVALDPAAEAVADDVPPDQAASRAFAIVGLGNPTAELADTPHSLGHRVVDELVRELGAAPWQDRGKFRIADAKAGDVTVHLIKTTTMMNISGPAVAEALAALDLDSHRCILVHDDAMSDLGSVRNRDRGSDGGHRGVRSVLQALDTDEILRLKIGVRTARRDGRTAEQFLIPFPDDEKDKVARVCATARARALELIRTRG